MISLLCHWLTDRARPSHWSTGWTSQPHWSIDRARPSHWSTGWTSPPHWSIARARPSHWPTGWTSRPHWSTDRVRPSHWSTGWTHRPHWSTDRALPFHWSTGWTCPTDWLTGRAQPPHRSSRGHVRPTEDCTSTPGCNNAKFTTRSTTPGPSSGWWIFIGRYRLPLQTNFGFKLYDVSVFCLFCLSRCTDTGTPCRSNVL